MNCAAASLDMDERAAPAACDAFAQAADWLATPGADERVFTPTALAATAAMIEAIAECREIDIDALAAAIGAPRVVAEAFAAFAEWRLGAQRMLQ